MLKPDMIGYPKCGSYDIDLYESIYLNNVGALSGALDALRKYADNFYDPGPLRLGYCNCSVELTRRKRLEFNSAEYNVCM